MSPASSPPVGAEPASHSETADDCAEVCPFAQWVGPDRVGRLGLRRSLGFLDNGLTLP